LDFLQIIRDDRGEFASKFLSRTSYKLRLVSVEIRRGNHLLQVCKRYFQNIIRFANSGKQRRGYLIDLLIRRLSGENHRNQELKRRLVMKLRPDIRVHSGDFREDVRDLGFGFHISWKINILFQYIKNIKNTISILQILSMLFDTHTHTYFPEFALRQDEIVASMQESSIRYATQIGCDIETSRQAIELAKRYESYYATVGYHPTEGQTLSREEIPEMVRELEGLLQENREYIVAVGEIGFDYYHLEEGNEGEQKETQRILFFEMTELALKYNLPVIIHTRDAHEDTLRYIKESGVKKAIVHCFSEDYAFAQELMEYSDEIFFSFSGIVTYPKAVKIRETAKLLPLSKILIETDAPFLSPQAVRGTINEPANVRYTLEAIKNLRSESGSEIERVIYENSLRVYGREILSQSGNI